MTEGSAPEAPPRGRQLSSGAELPEIVPRRRYGRWVGAGLTALAALWVVVQLLTNDAFRWSVVAEYMLSPIILEGLQNTIILTLTAMGMGAVIGVVLAIMRLSGNAMLKWTSSSYIWFFRGTPALVQLVFWFNLASLYPEISLGIPFGGPKFYSINSNVAVTSFVAALLGLGLNQGAYMAEIVRAGLLGVDAGQIEAAKSMGMHPSLRLRRVILPQAMRMIIPPTGNQLIGMLKFTSLASVVAFHELLLSAQTVYNRTFQTIPLLVVASIWYLILTTALTIGQRYVEQYYAKGAATKSGTGGEL